jgi:RNA 2',3'-cyclic 3'-phosphodiesterase
LRAFFGVPLPDMQRERLDFFMQRCATAAPDFRWSDPHNLHLTVRFIGSIESDMVDEIANRVESSPGQAFDVELGAVGTFNRGRLARVVWLGLRHGGDELRRLAERVEQECQVAGLEAEERPFSPHLTLARAKGREGATLPALPDLPDLPPWRANEVVLYSSHLGRAGATHEPIRRIALGPLAD